MPENNKKDKEHWERKQESIKELITYWCKEDKKYKTVSHELMERLFNAG